MSRRVALLVGLGLVTAGACGPERAVAPATDPIRVVDALKREVTLPGPPQRIVSLNPALTETLFAIGAGDRVVAVTENDDYPPAAAQLPKVGGFGPQNQSVERILSLRPDFVVAATFALANVEAVGRAGVPGYMANANSFDEVYATIADMGTVTGHSAEAAELVAAMRARLAAVAARAKPGRRPRVLFLVDLNQLIAAGPDSLIGRLVAAAGGDNVVAAGAADYPTLSDESLLTNPPDVVLVADSLLAEAKRVLPTRPGWRTVPAVKAGAIRGVPDDQTQRGGPRLVEGVEAIARAIGQ